MHIKTISCFQTGRQWLGFPASALGKFARRLCRGKTISTTGKRGFQGTPSLKATAPNPQTNWLLIQSHWSGAKSRLLTPRHYPKDFGVALASLIAQQLPSGDLRNKRNVDPTLTDREIFDSLKIGDPWWDAGLPDLYWYLRKLPSLKIPSTWESTIEAFEEELLSVSCFQFYYLYIFGTSKPKQNRYFTPILLPGVSCSSEIPGQASHYGGGTGWPERGSLRSAFPSLNPFCGKMPLNRSFADFGAPKITRKNPQNTRKNPQILKSDKIG